MVESQLATAWSLLPGRDGPAIIAHAAGNTAMRAAAAMKDQADFVEVDLWVSNGRFEARHERSLYPLPFLFEKWYLRTAPRRPFGLRELLQATDGKVDILLDLKNGGETAARLVHRSIQEANSSVRVAASSQHWRTLRAVQQIAPEVVSFYSIDVQAKLDLFLSVIERDTLPRGVSCRHSLLSADLVQRFHDRGLLVVAWTVDDIDRARVLASWGVDGITTHKISEVRAELVRAP